MDKASTSEMVLLAVIGICYDSCFQKEACPTEASSMRLYFNNFRTQDRAYMKCAKAVSSDPQSCEIIGAIQSVLSEHNSVTNMRLKEPQ